MVAFRLAAFVVFIGVKFGIVLISSTFFSSNMCLFCWEDWDNSKYFVLAEFLLILITIHIMRDNVVGFMYYIHYHLYLYLYDAFRPAII